MEKKDLHLEEKLEKRIEETEKHLEERREHIQERKEIVHEHYEEINKQLATKSFKEILMGTFSIKEDTAAPEVIRDRILSGGKVTGTNMVIMSCAIMIASIGLTVNSIPVIIGAMLVSPLMGSLHAIAYGSVTGNGYMIERYLTGIIMQTVISLLTSTVYFMIAPITNATSELLARTSPSFYDVFIAIFGGVAGIIGQTREDKANNVIPGVAIATAIMPPLCTCGYSIANQNWGMLKGAAYLYIINCYFIYSSAEVVLTLLKLPEGVKLSPEERKRYTIRKVRTTFIVLLPCIALLFSIRMWG
ncbi:MAG: DUF389 domain-containing protein [Lachnospiraceae bacterium]|nr:DUF389 domain-containing protein [Lachnospiraceae bacterium]